MRLYSATEVNASALSAVSALSAKAPYHGRGRLAEVAGFRTLRVVSLLWVACLSLWSARAEDWPRFLGPRADNISAETNLLEQWPASVPAVASAKAGGPPVLWQKQIGSGYSAPSVIGDKLVLHHRVGPEEIVECLDAGTGERRWRYAYPSQFNDPFGYNNGPRCTPLLTAKLCFTFGAEGKLLCLETETGKLLWERETSKDWQVPEPFFGVGSTPWLEGTTLVVMVGGQPNSTMVGFDAGTGKTLWQNVGRSTWEGTPPGSSNEPPYRWTGEEKLASYSSPIGATIHGRRHILCLTRQGLVSLNPTNGSVNFCRRFQSPVDQSVNAMSPVVSGDLVLVSSAYYRLGSVLLRVHPDGKGFNEIWRSPPRANADPENTRNTKPVLEAHWNTPVLCDGYLYAFSGRNENDASFRCIELKTGRLTWSRDERWAPHSSKQPSVYGRGSAILAAGKLIVLGEGGRLGLFSPNPKQPEEIRSWQIPQLQYPCWTAPILAHKRLYLRDEKWLICFDLVPKL